MNEGSHFRDRLGYGGVMLVFGVPVGGFLGLLGAAVSQPPHFNVAALVVTVVVFFVIGFALLDRGADFLSVCLHSVALVFWATIGLLGGGPPPYEPQQRDFSPTWCFLALIAWLTAVVIALLKF